MHLQRRDLLKMAVASALAISVPGFGARDKAAEIVAVLAEPERRAAGRRGQRHDVAVAWPNDATPSFIIAAYYEADGEYDEMRSEDIAVLRQVGEEIATLRRT